MCGKWGDGYIIYCTSDGTGSTTQQGLLIILHSIHLKCDERFFQLNMEFICFDKIYDSLWNKSYISQFTYTYVINIKLLAVVTQPYFYHVCLLNFVKDVLMMLVVPCVSTFLIYMVGRYLQRISIYYPYNWSSGTMTSIVANDTNYRSLVEAPHNSDIWRYSRIGSHFLGMNPLLEMMAPMVNVHTYRGVSCLPMTRGAHC